MRLLSASLATSTLVAKASPPWSRMKAATFSASAPSRSAIQTLPPSSAKRRAAALPMPDAPPVMTIDLPWKLLLVIVSLGRLGGVLLAEVRDQMLADLADRGHRRLMRHSAHLHEEQDLVRARSLQTLDIADRLVDRAVSVFLDMVVAGRSRSDRDFLFAQIGDELVLRMLQLRQLRVGIHVFGHRLRPAGIPIADGFGEEALAAHTDPPRLLPIVHDDRRAERRQVLRRTEAHLVLGLPLAEGLAIHVVFLLDLVRSREAQHQCAQAAGARGEQALLTRAGHVHRRVRLLIGLGIDRPRRDRDQVALVLEIPV